LNQEISTLIALQDTDTKLAELDRETETLRQELAGREQAVRDKETQAAQCRENAVDLEQSRDAVKAAAEAAAERIREGQIRMMQVQTSREHQALLKEIEEAKQQIKDTDDRLLQLMEEAEAEEAKAAELDNICKGEQKLLAAEAGRVDKAVREIDRRRAEVIKLRRQFAEALPSARLKRYEMLLQKRKGLAVVRIIDGVCQGCFMMAPPQQYNEVRKGEQICSCPSCQRILYYLPSDEADGSGGKQPADPDSAEAEEEI
jgi:predicted  nucleic acid-binding Zn-ribbon protein